MYRILARRRARAVALSNCLQIQQGPVAGPSGATETVATSKGFQYSLDYATWHAALSGHNDGRGAGANAAPSFDLQNLLNSEAEAA
jgi:hypothetical protein